MASTGGVAAFAAFFDGRRIAPLNVGKIRDKLAKLQRRLARKVKRSSNWVKLKGRITLACDVFCWRHMGQDFALLGSVIAFEPEIARRPIAHPRRFAVRR